jgi:PAS domain S-box-containing protein/putative nucleotidyltransferase with HDIG domain
LNKQGAKSGLSETQKPPKTSGTFADHSLRRQAQKAQLRRAQELQALYETSLAINSQLDLPTLLQAIIQNAARLLSTDMGAVYLTEPDQQSLVLAVSYNLPDEYLGVRLRFGEGLAGQVVSTGAPAMTGDYQEFHNKAAVYQQSPFRRVLAVPLKLKEQIIGVVAVADSHQTGLFSSDDVRLFSHFADQAVIAIQNARLYDAVQHELADRRHAEGALLESEERFRTIFDSINDAIIVQDIEEDVILEVNQKMCEMWGYTRSEALRVTVDQLSAGDQPYSQREFFGWVTRARKGAAQLFEWKARHKNGRVFWIEVNMRRATIGDEDVVLMVVRDISERKRAEQMQLATYRISELAQTTQTLDQLFGAIQAVLSDFMPAENFYIAFHDPTTDLIHFPYQADARDGQLTPIPAAKSLTGYVLKTGKPLLVDPEAFNQLVQAGEVELVGSSSVDWLGVPLRTQSGETIGVVAIQTYDISIRLDERDKDMLAFVSNQIAMAIEQMRVHEDLRESEQRYRGVFEYAPVGIFQSTPEGKYIYVNPELARLFGYDSPQELIETVNQADIASILYVEPERHKALVDEVIHADTWKYYENLYRRKDGSIIVARLSLRTTRDPKDAETYLTGFIEDITERRQAQEAIRLHAARGEALLRVAASLNAQLNLDTLLETVCAEAAHALNAPFSWVALYDEQHGLLRGMEAFGMPPDFTKNFRPILRNDFNSYLEQYGTLSGVPDVRSVTDLPNCDQLAGLDIQPVACSSMVREGQLVGAICVAKGHDAAPFTNDELTLLKGIGDQAAQAILNNRLFSDVERHLQYERLLHSVDLVITTSNSNLAFSLNVILLQVAGQLKVDAADVLLLNPECGAFEYTVGCGFKTDVIRGTRLEAEKLAGDLLNSSSRLICYPELSETSLGPGRRELVKAEGFASYFSSPLIIKDQARGLLEVFHRSPLDPNREWLDFLGSLSTQIAIAIDNITLFENLQNSNAELEKAYDTTLEGWSRALDLRDRETEGHSRRVTEMTVALAQALGVSKADLVHIRRGALLHDIGKMGVPDEILRKSNQLSEQDWAIMRKHPVLAYDLLKPVAFLRPALDIPYCHHERWDGKGYPRGLKGEEIPRPARIFAILDVWDALNSDRPYSAAWSEPKVLEYILSQKGKHFDPEVVDAFMSILDTIRSISASTPPA